MNNKPELSPNFTVADIRKLRDYNSLRHKNMTTNELNEELNKSAMIINKRIEELRKAKNVNIRM